MFECPILAKRVRKPVTLVQILVDSDLRYTRLLLVTMSLLWAFFLLLPSELFIPSRKTYWLMAYVAPEFVWGVAFALQGLWGWYTLRTGVRNRVTLAMDAIFGCVLWTSSTALCFAAHWPYGHGGFIDQLLAYPPPAAMSGELAMTIASWWHLVHHWASEETAE